MALFYNTILTCFIYYITGKSFINNSNNLSNTCLSIINGAIILSFIGLFFNFFFSLDFLTNTILYLIILVYFFFKNPTYKIFNFKILKYVFYISLFATILIFLAESNRPDSGLYHFPIVKLLNDEKIIIGITNISWNFGLSSIIQYLQAISNNYITKSNGMLLPLSILPSAIYLYFFNEILNQLKTSKTQKTYTLFIFFSLVFFTYKMNRYGEYGNDYLGHYLVFLLFSFLLKYEKKTKFSYIYFYSIFIFLNKIIFLNILIVPIILFLMNFKKDKFINKLNIFSTIFILLFLLKNILNSGCLFWPIEKTCFKNLEWFNTSKNNVNVSNLNIQTEAWSKGFPDRKDKSLSHKEYIKNNEWINTWTQKHGKKVLKIVSMYLVILFIIMVAFNLIEKNKKIHKVLRKKENKHLFFYLIVTFIGILFWFFKFPVFRFGVSNIIIFIIFILIIFFYGKDTSLSKRGTSFIKIMSLICLFIFVSKNMIKFSDLNTKYNNYPWPRYYSFNNENLPIKLKKIYVENTFSHYFADGLCMYSKSPCTNYKIDKKLKLRRKFKYKIYYF